MAAKIRLTPGAQARLVHYDNVTSPRLHPRVVVAAGSLASTATYTVTFSTTLTINIASSLPSGDTLDRHRNPKWAAASCVIKIPYAWKLGSGATYSVGYDVIVNPAGTNPEPRGSVYTGVSTCAVPASGSTTNLAYAVTL